MPAPEPIWLQPRAVPLLHDEQLARFGGPRGLLSPGGLESAMGRPKHAFAYGETDLATLAALYAGGIIRGHPFADGNKRTGFIAAAVFLAVNGRDLIADQGEVVAFCLGLAAGEIDEAVFAAWLRDRGAILI